MNRRDLERYLWEVARQARFGVVAFEDLERAHDVDRIYLAAQSLVVAAGNVSKILWPQDSKSGWARGRGVAVREALEAHGGVLKQRTLRNDLEHFDERLDEWIAERGGLDHYVDFNVGPIAMFQMGEPLNWLRHYDPDTKIYYFRGEQYELSPLHDALSDLFFKAHAVLATGLTRDSVRDRQPREDATNR